MAGLQPEETVAIHVRHPAHDEFGQEISTVGTFDADGKAINVSEVGKEDLASYFRDQLSNPETRADFAAIVGVPELVNLTSLPPVPKPLPLSDLIENHVRGKTFKHARQYQDARRWW